MESFINQSGVQQVEEPAIIEIKKKQERNSVLQDVRKLIDQGWPATVKPYQVPCERLGADLWIKHDLLMHRER